MSRTIRNPKSVATLIFTLCALVCAILMLVLQMDAGVAQTYQRDQRQRSTGECSPNVIGSGNTVNCPVVRHSGQCPPNYIYSRTHGDCIPIQHRGGVIPCSPDDMRFVPGRGWISNCSLKGQRLLLDRVGNLGRQNRLSADALPFVRQTSVEQTRSRILNADAAQDRAASSAPESQRRSVLDDSLHRLFLGCYRIIVCVRLSQSYKRPLSIFSTAP